MILVKLVGIVFVLVGFIILAFGLGIVYGLLTASLNGLYFVTLGIVLILIGAVLIAVLGTIKEGRAKSVMTSKI